MEPLSALTIATSVVQFIDFTVKVVLKAREVYQEGTSIDIDNIKKRIEKLKSFVTGFSAPISGRNNALEGEYKALDETILECSKVAMEIIAVLENLISTSDKRTLWKSFHAALRTILKKEEIEGLVKTLEGYQQDLSLRLLALLNSKQDLVLERLDQLDPSSKRIVQISLFSQSSSKNSVSGNLPEKTSSNQEGHSTRETVLRAILGLKDGSTLALADEELGLGEQGNSLPERQIERVVTFSDQNTSSSANTVSNERFSPLATNVLALLSYRGIQNRFNAVMPAHHETYAWIHRAPTEDRRWSDFGKWLPHGEGIYWITGKPGSGKSTLMKYICSNAETDKALQVWKGKSTLLKSEFFFWAAGTTMQSSQEGLVRGILFSLLTQCPQLIPSIFPDICKDILAGKDVDPTWTLSELRAALSLLIDKPKGLKICLFIDGLDEYSGEPSDLVDLVVDLSSHKHVKLVLSSRPWNIFYDAFSDAPQLSLQELTSSDIRMFVTSSLMGSRALEEMKSLQPQIYEIIVQEICEKSAGVFLWVRLAVRSILSGLQNGDSLSQLHARLRSLPTDLEQMYQQMFNALDPATRTSAARIILMMLRNKEMPRDEPMSLLQLALADDEDTQAEKVIGTEMRIMPADQRRALCLRMRRRINSRTQGLLEVTGATNIAERGSSSIDGWVEFIHRTAIDFFRLKDLWEILKTSAGVTFNTDLTLLIACLHEMKIIPSERAIIADADRSIANMRQALLFASFLEDRNMRPYTAVLDDLEKTMRLHWRKATMFKKRTHEENWTSTKDMTFDCFIKQQHDISMFEISGFQDQQPFLCLALSYHCSLYAADKASWEEAVTAEQTHMVNNLPHTRLPLFSEILDIEAESSTRMNLCDCWREFITALDPERTNFQRRLSNCYAANNVLDLCLAFLQAGVNPNLAYPEQFKNGSCIMLDTLKRFRTAVYVEEKSQNLIGHGNQLAMDEFNAKYEEIQSFWVKPA